MTIRGALTRRTLSALFAGSSLALVLAGCGTSSAPTVPAVAPAKTYRLAGFKPAGPIKAGRPVEVALRILQPSGVALTHYRTGAGPHTGIDLIIVPSDLRTLFYEDPPIAKSGSIGQAMTFPAAGSYRIVVDAFPNTPGVPTNVQLFAKVHVTGAKPAPAPSFTLTTRVGGYRFAIQGRPRLRAIEPAYLTIKVTDGRGRPVAFSPLDGALAHAIFFREGTLDYVHTHVCAPAALACASATRGPVGSTPKRGVLRVGVLLPAAGSWRLFLRTKIAGRELVTPFTLSVR